MPLVYAVIVPHPPIMVPEVGKKEGLKPIEKTVNSMLKISKEIGELDPEVLAIITPHGPVFPEGINLRMPQGGGLSGNLWQFGASDVRLDFKLAQGLAEKIIEDGRGMKVQPVEDDTLDHGVMAPLYYVAKALVKPAELISMNISLESYRVHYKFGQVLAKTFSADPRRIAFLASGDLSHRLTEDAPAGYSSEGKKFDEKLVKCLEGGKIEEILNFDPFWVDEVGECGLRSVSALLGLVSGLKAEQEICSYEGPYGVGYLVASYKINP